MSGHFASINGMKIDAQGHNVVAQSMLNMEENQLFVLLAISNANISYLDTNMEAWCKGD